MLKRRVKSDGRVGTIEIGFFDHVQRPICVFFLEGFEIDEKMDVENKVKFVEKLNIVY